MLVGRHGSELVERRVLRRTRHDGWNGVVIRDTHASEHNVHRTARQFDVEAVCVAPHLADLGTRNPGSDCDRNHLLWCRARHHYSGLTLPEKESARGNLRPAREIDLGSALTLEVGDTALRESDSEAPVAAVVRGAHNPRADRAKQDVYQDLLALEIAAGRGTEHLSVNRGQILASS